MKKIICLIFCLILFSGFTVFAEESEEYNEIYRESGLENIKQYINDDTAELLGELGIEPSDYESILNRSSGNIFKTLIHIFTDGIKKPFTACMLSIAVLSICSTVSGMWSQKLKIGQSYSYMCVLSLSAIVLLPMVADIKSAIAAIKCAGVFMLGFIPVFSILLVSSGSITTAGVYQATMLTVCEVISQTSSLVISPLISVYIALGISAALSGINGIDKLAVLIKSAVQWILGLAMMIFTGFLSLQSIIGKAADSLKLRTTKFFVGSLVPVVGGALSEAVNTVTAAMSLVNSTAAVWGIIVISVMFLPYILKLLCWKLVMSVLSGIGAIFNVDGAEKLFDVCGAAIGIIEAVLFCIMTMFILSLIVILLAR